MATNTKAKRNTLTEIDDTPIDLTPGDDPRVDSRTIAARLGIEHESVMRTLHKYPKDFRVFGILRFEIGEIKGAGQPEKYALLNEDQAYLLLTYSRNTKRVRETKIALVQAFRKARLATNITKNEYLPTYHDLHDKVGLLAAGSRNKHFVHSNINRLLNKTVGIGAGQRGKLDLHGRSLMVVAQSGAISALDGAENHHDGYHAVRLRLNNFKKSLGLVGFDA